MNFKFLFLIFAVILSSFTLSSCSAAEASSSPEVVIDKKDKTSGSDEVIITNADLKKNLEPVTATRPGEALQKRMLADQSQIETLIDGYGNKVETRSFSGHPRVEMVVVRTSINGEQQVTVYSKGNGAKFVPEIADIALTGTGDEIANAAKLNDSEAPLRSQNFMKGSKAPALQPLPSSAFQTPSAPVNQPLEPTQSETSVKSQSSETQSTKIENEN